MTTFEELLKATLKGVNSSFDTVDQDLHDVVAEAATGVEKVTNGGARLYLEKVRELAEGVVYSLRLHISEQHPKELLGVMVSRAGYPIYIDANSSRLANLVFASASQILGRDELRDYFVKMANNPNSPLVVNLAFFFRKKLETPA